MYLWKALDFVPAESRHDAVDTTMAAFMAWLREGARQHQESGRPQTAQVLRGVAGLVEFERT